LRFATLLGDDADTAATAIRDTWSTQRMSYFAACLIVIFSTLVAAGASNILRRRLQFETRRRHHDVGNPIFLQLGLLFAVLLAFVYSDVQTGYNAAAEAINGECGALHGAAMLANALPDKKGEPLERAILTYTKAIVVVEWPAMADRHRSSETAEALRAALELASHLDVTRPADVAVQSQILTLLVNAHARRETRIFQMSLGLPPIMWIVLISNALVLIWFVLLAGVESLAGQIMFAGAFTGCTVSILVLVRMLEHPFEGALTLSNDDFAKLLGEVTKLVAG
jgi:hypothetical protein